jgi:hypothetical protein
LAEFSAQRFETSRRLKTAIQGLTADRVLIGLLNPVPHTRAHDWKTLVERLDDLYASGEILRPDDFISDFSNGEPTVFFEEDVWPKLLQWVRDAYALAEREGPAKVRDEMWRLVQEHTGKTIATLDDLYQGVFAHPLEQRDWDPKGESDPEDYYSGNDVAYLAQAFMQEMLALARLAADMPPRLEGPDPVSGLVSVEWVAKLRGVQPDTILKEIWKYEREHGEKPPWVWVPPNRQRGQLIEWPVYFHTRAKPL